VYSARYAVEHNDKANRQKLLKNLEGKTDRSAYFICVIVKLFSDGTYLAVEGKTYGQILTEERGDTSFGFDCLFYSDELQKTFGEATSDEKNSVSHRGRALQNLLKADKR
ncbi:MAG: non-canonical purine NTP pyrophosphatase, partial [Clostridia bacterium]|nr:non-canonical purine NTP pyrophosphatase [Clostridia bacterium]